VQSSDIGYRKCYAVLSQFNNFQFDEYLSSGTVTYRNDHLGQSSHIDHMYVSKAPVLLLLK